MPRNTVQRLNPLTETVLIGVTGQSPAVLTETVWALAKEKPRILPTRVIAITTIEGKKRIQAELIQAGLWESLRKQLKAKPGELLFGSSDSIRIISSRIKSEDLNDICSVDDNMAAADTILEVVRGFTSNPDVRVIASLAGGRKTMGAFMALAMTLVGRPEDRLCHVLVNPPFDSIYLKPKFYFPSIKPACHRLNQPFSSGEKEILSDLAQIELADVPFVPLSELFERDLKQPAGGYSNLVARLRRRIHEGELPMVMVDTRFRIVRVGAEEVMLAPKEFTVFELIARRHIEGLPRIVGWKQFAGLMVPGLGWTQDEIDNLPMDGCIDLRKKANRIRQKLTEKLSNPSWAERLSLTHPGTRGHIALLWPKDRLVFQKL